MNPNDINIDDLLKILSKKRGRNMDPNEMIYDFKQMAIKQLEDVFKVKKYTNREITKKLDEYEFTFLSFQMGLKDNIINVDPIHKATLLVLLDVQLKLIENIRKNMKESGRFNFNILSYLSKEKYINTMNKPSKQNKPSKSSKPSKPNKKARKEEELVDDDDADDADDADNDDDNDDDDNDDIEEYESSSVNEDDEEEEEEKYTTNKRKNENEDEDSELDDLLIDEDDYDLDYNNKVIVINKHKNKVEQELLNKVYDKGPKNIREESLDYLTNLSSSEKEKTLSLLKDITNYQTKSKPVIFQIMNFPLPIKQKIHILENYLEFVKSRDHKLEKWINGVLQIPFGNYVGTDIKTLNPKNIQKYLDDIKKSMDYAVYGHNEAKSQIIQVIGQQIRNPEAKGNVIGLYGPPGNGKSSLIKEGISKAMDRPFIYISLGGANESNFLVGHSFTWHGSVWGKIVDGLMSARCMNPIIYFDELDKVSQTDKGREIINILVHLTDPVQNNHFHDEFFNGIDIDLSRATLIFSFNDIKSINPVLLDRITTIHTKSLLLEQKLHICNNYLLPTIYKDIGFPEKALLISNDILTEIIEKYTHEGGVRKIKSLLYVIIRELNLCNLTNLKLNGHEVKFPFKLTMEDVKTLFRNRNDLENEAIEEIYNKERTYNIKDQSVEYLTNLKDNEKNSTFEKLNEIIKYQSKDKPILFQIMNFNISVEQKNYILNEYMLSLKDPHDIKLAEWVDAVLRIPFGQYKGLDIQSMKPDEIQSFLDSLKKSMDSAVYGHDEAKRQIVQIMAQQIRNPEAKGSIMGIYGCAGNGKTSLLKEGIAKAMNRPFVFIPLGGATEANFLVGHSKTWHGSTWGRIVDGLMTSKCMNPLIFFDELDKISQTDRGDEITNILIQLTDPVQNNHFKDKYFGSVDLDLSKATMIFSFNDPSKINPILLDRITCIETKYLLTSQKIHICNNYLLPVMCKEMGFKDKDIQINDDVIRQIINDYTMEGGIRKLKSLIYNIVRELNIHNLTKTKLNDKDINFPFTITSDDVKVIFKNKRTITPDKINTKPKCGIVNGLYAYSSGGGGGLLPIECVWIPSDRPMQVKATGSLEKVIKESTEVALSVAWNYLPDSDKNKCLDFWKNRSMGFHIHCGDGSTPKDGPSAGGALTLVLYSLLTNRKIKHDVAMTGEINLQGCITAIGGLEEKLEGARRAGCTLVLAPKENERDLIQIRDRNPSLLDDKFNVILIESFEEIIKYALLPPQITDTPFLTGLYREDNIESMVL